MGCESTSNFERSFTLPKGLRQNFEGGLNRASQREILVLKRATREQLQCLATSIDFLEDFTNLQNILNVFLDY